MPVIVSEAVLKSALARLLGGGNRLSKNAAIEGVLTCAEAVDGPPAEMSDVMCRALAGFICKAALALGRDDPAALIAEVTGAIENYTTQGMLQFRKEVGHG